MPVFGEQRINTDRLLETSVTELIQEARTQKNVTNKMPVFNNLLGPRHYSRNNPLNFKII